MISPRTVFRHLMTAVSLVTAMGVFVHDGRVDKASVTAMSSPEMATYVPETTISSRFQDFLETDAHTHPDHNAGRAALLSSFTYQSPSIPPRESQHRKHLLQMVEPRGRHAFDNYYLPIIA